MTNAWSAQYALRFAEASLAIRATAILLGKRVDYPDFFDQTSPGILFLAALVVVALWFSGMPFFLQEARLLISSGPRSSNFWLITLGNTLIATATVLYVANFFLTLKTVWPWASRLAAGGAGLLIADIILQVFGLGRVSANVLESYLALYNLVSVIVPMAVIWYLVIEHAHRRSAAGAFVMPVILCLIGLEMWLIAERAGDPSLILSGFVSYWGQAYLLAHVIGYGAFVLAAMAGMLYLVRYQLDTRGRPYPAAARFLPDSWRAQTLILSCLGVGVPVFVLALFFATGWGLGAAAWKIIAWLKGLWILTVLGFYGGLLYVLHTRSMPGHRMAWWSVAGLAATLATYLATQVLTLAIAAPPPAA
jgi:hypothetical protein